MVSKFCPDEYYVQHCGYWVRKVALLVRLVWAFTGVDDMLWILLYVDKFLFLVHLSRFWPQATLILFLLCIFGTPFSSLKLVAGLQLAWIGYHLIIGANHIGGKAADGSTNDVE